MNPNLYTTAQRRAGMRLLVMLHLKKFGGRATAREVAESLGKPLKNVWPRFTELKDTGQIRDTGQRVQPGRGRPQVIWATVEDTAPENDAHAASGDVPAWFKEFGV